MPKVVKEHKSHSKSQTREKKKQTIYKSESKENKIDLFLGNSEMCRVKI